jgi:hypothetical protein
MIRKFISLTLIFSFLMVYMPKALAEDPIKGGTDLSGLCLEDPCPAPAPLAIKINITATVEGINNFMSETTRTVADLIKNAELGLCDPSVIDKLKNSIKQLELLRKFLGMNTGLLFNLVKKKVPAPFNNLNYNDVSERRDALINKIENLRMDLMMQGKTSTEIEAILTSKGAYAALARADKALEIAKSLQGGVESIIMLLEGAIYTIKYICEANAIADTTAMTDNSTYPTVVTDTSTYPTGTTDTSTYPTVVTDTSTYPTGTTDTSTYSTGITDTPTYSTGTTDTSTYYPTGTTDTYGRPGATGY